MQPRIFLVTDPLYDDDRIVHAVDVVGTALGRGVLGVQLRDKKRDLVAKRLLASRLRLVTRARGALFIVNADARLARDVGADGVHLGGDAGTIAAARAVCGARAWVSIAAHGDEAVRAAVRERANAVLVSPIFPTTSGAGESETRMKAARTKRPRGVEAIESARAIVGTAPVAIYALGGVVPSFAGECIRAGADGVAVIRALLAADDPAAEAQAFAAAMGELGSPPP
jgi:thiamine-phosphate pyrophosphorylase